MEPNCKPWVEGDECDGLIYRNYVYILVKIDGSTGWYSGARLTLTIDDTRAYAENLVATDPHFAGWRVLRVEPHLYPRPQCCKKDPYTP